jgi:uncharacterized protein (DUF302 family)
MDANAPHGLVTLPSARAAAETTARLEALLAEKGIRLFARIDHADGAREAGLSLRPTMLLLFGDPRAGTPLMQSRQTAAIDLPLKILVWEDDAGRCCVSYNRPEYVAERHGISDRAEAVAKIAAGLDGLARAAAAP